MKELHLQSHSRLWPGKLRWSRPCPGYIAIILLPCLMLLAGCRDQGATLYHRFPNHVWERFNILRFEMPVQQSGHYNVQFFARFSAGFSQEKLPLNMVLNTAEGEERIREFEMPVRSNTGRFIVGCAGDSCEGTLELKRDLNIAEPGILKIEIENLTPHIRTEEILGVGIRLEKSR